MTSHYRHRRIHNPAANFPGQIEPGEIMVNTANRQLALGDADPTSPGETRQLIGVRFFDAKGQYAGGEFVVEAGLLYQAKDTVLPGPFDPLLWDAYASEPALKAYIDAADATITTGYQGADTTITTGYQRADTEIAAALTNKVSRGGDTMAGPLQLAGPPTGTNEAATKGYVDATVATGGATPHADQIITTPLGNLSAVNVQLTLYELDLEKAPIESPQFNGTPRSPTPPPDDNSISIATTAFVAGQASTIEPLADGTAAVGASLRYAREDHVHPGMSGGAALDSPAFTGTPTAPTPPPGDNDKSLATTEFVTQALAAGASFSTGDVKMTIKTSADAGWVMMSDGTIGSVSSGASARANADCNALFVLLWNNIPNTYCAVSGGRGVAASNDWSANKTIALPKALGRVLAIAGAGVGLSGRALGQFLGEENHTLVAAEVPNLSVSVNNGGASGSTSAAVTSIGMGSQSAGAGSSETGGFTSISVVSSVEAAGLSCSVGGSSGSGGTTTGGGGGHNTMQPTTFLNVMIKL